MLSSPVFTRQFGPRVRSTTLALAWVAAGRRAAYVTEGDLRDSVHFAAGIALCSGRGLHRRRTAWTTPFTQEWAVWSPLLTSTPTQP
jgi:fructose-1,6-bisphosphatase/inositol monophosphatase family enzyme